MDEGRANPEEILRKLQAQETDSSRGHLKIFFGYAAGVGKTYAMLKAAGDAKENGRDVVVGYVEPHARPQTLALLAGLEQLPTMSVNHKGMTLQEFDLDEALRRKPSLLLVDELAHSNAETCRHKKRYQDVEELLKAGIDVYTTINVQHIESLNDIVASITGVMVRERIPDKVFDRADQVELVDIEPVELIERLQAGKIYRETQAQRALGHFFTTENLTALREISLRRCADRVNKIADKARQAQGGSYRTDEHVLVCLSSSPSNAKIIRTAARMSSAFKGSFTALFVETPDFALMREDDRKRLRANITLAQQLGATIETVYGDDVPLQIAEFARLSGVSKIVVGRSNTGRRAPWRKAALTERLIEAAPNLDIYIIPDKDAKPYRPVRSKPQPFQLNGTDLLKSLVLLLLATGIGALFHHFGFSEANIITIYILSVMITAVITEHRWYSLVSSIVSVLIFNFCFTAPYFSLEAYDSGYPLTFAIMFLSAFLTSGLAVKITQNAKQSAQTAYRTKILLETNQLLQKAEDKNSLMVVTAGQLAKLLSKDIVFYPAEGGVLAPPLVFSATEEKADYLSNNEKAVATWVFQNNQHAGASTNTLGSAQCLYLAVRVKDTVYGVVGVAMVGESLDAAEHSVMLSILGECALALENRQVLKEREEAAVLAKNEQLRANLLRSISHDLRTPLTAISGNASILLSDEGSIDKAKRKLLYTDIYDDALWLINLVENLLSVTRIEDGSMRLRLTAELLEEVVAEALRHVNRKSAEHTILVEQAADFIIAKMDARLIVQVIINMVDNAIKYTPVGSMIVLRTSIQEGFAVISVADNGGGIAPESKPNIFDMFFTAGTQSADSRRSLGLGLALCKSIIHAHGGQIWVEDNEPKGTIFAFTLPLEELTLHE